MRTRRRLSGADRRNEEYVKRAGFVLMAALAVHDKKAENKIFLEFLDVIKEHCTDERNFVKKAVNWALRQKGKRSQDLNKRSCYRRIATEPTQ